MEEFLPVIASSPLFSGVSENELTAMLSCLGTRTERFPKDAFLLRAGDMADSVGLVLSGSVLVIQEDVWGNRNILSKVGPGQTFAVAFACAPGSALNVSVSAEMPVTAMFLNVKRVLTVCPSACEHHSRIIRNLLGELAEKNLRFSEKLTHMGQRTTRAKLLSYFSAEAQKRGTYEFDVPFSRQQLADYLAVERSGLMVEFQRQDQKELIPWVSRHFATQKKRISNELCTYLIDITGGTMTALNGEIEKICAYSGADEIKKSDIDAVTEPVLDAVVFQMTDRISEGAYEKAFQCLQQLLKMQQEPLAILGAVGSHFRRLGVAKCLQESGKGPYELQKLCGIPDYPARKLMDASRRLDKLFCADACAMIMETDYQMKTSYDDSQRLLELLILRLAVEARHG